MNDIFAAIHQASLAFPDRATHISAGQNLLYQDLERDSERLAAYLARTLPDDHSPVAVLGRKEPQMLVAFLAAVKAGHPYIPIDSTLPPLRIDTILNTAQVTSPLTPPEIIAILAENAHLPAHPPARQILPDDPWYIIFTSGSTGDPKGVVITAGCLLSFVQWMLSEHRLVPGGEVFLNQAPFSFDLSVMDMYLSLVTGGTLFSLTKDEIADPARLFHVLGRSTVTVWVSTPSFAQMCTSEPGFGPGMLPDLHKFLFCGETLPPQVAAELLQRFPAAEIWNTYGPTETTCATTSIQIDEAVLAKYSPLPVGFPKPGSPIYVVDENGQSVPDGQRGEIIISGPNVSPGYLARPDLTARSFSIRDGQPAYRTGDNGHFIHGLLFYDGRIDLQVKLHGYRIELGDVEANLRALPAVKDAAVLPVYKNGLPDSLTAFVVLDAAPPVTDYELSRTLRRELGYRLPAYMTPRKFIFLAAFPITPNGKVDRRKLAESLA